MKKSEWLEADDPTAMLSWLGRPYPGWVEGTDSDGASFRHYVTDRKLRLLACAVVRSLYTNGLQESHKYVKQAVLVADRFADGRMDDKWRGRSMNAADLIQGYERELAFGCLRQDSMAGLAEVIRRHSLMDRFGDQRESRRIVAKLIRDFFGDPWDEVRLAWDQREVPCPDCPEGDPEEYCDDCSGSGTVKESVYPWLTPDVTMLAERAYSEVDPNLGTMDDLTLMALADALEEAGCEDVRILRHLRRPKTCPICKNAGFYDADFSIDSRPRYGADFFKRHVIEVSKARRTPCLCNNLCGPIYRGDWAVDLLLWKK